MHSNYYIYNKDLIEECDKGEYLEVNGATTTSCLKRRF